MRSTARMKGPESIIRAAPSFQTMADVPPRALQPFLALLAEDPAAVRRRGGPAAVWAEQRDRSILIEQIDLSRVLEERDVEHPARRKDDLWRAIVRAVLEKRRALDEA